MSRIHFQIKLGDFYCQLILIPLLISKHELFLLKNNFDGEFQIKFYHQLFWAWEQILIVKLNVFTQSFFKNYSFSENKKEKILSHKNLLTIFFNWKNTCSMALVFFYFNLEKKNQCIYHLCRNSSLLICAN